VWNAFSTAMKLSLDVMKLSFDDDRVVE